jgi:hypothetical protein
MPSRSKELALQRIQGNNVIEGTENRHIFLCGDGSRRRRRWWRSLLDLVPLFIVSVA